MATDVMECEAGGWFLEDSVEEESPRPDVRRGA